MKRTCLYILLSLLLAGCTGVAAAYPLSTSEAPAFPNATPELQPAATVEILAPFLQPAPVTEVPLEQPQKVGSLISTPTAASQPAEDPYQAYAYGPVGYPANINTLTGLPVTDPALLERRPMAIKVTNFPRSVRPQWGLSQADHIYEYYIGDHMTRFIGVFLGRDAAQVGPVRSARYFDEQILRMYDAIFVFGWADDPILERLTQPDIRNQLVVEREENCPPLCRLESGQGYNNLFADTHLLSQYVSERGTDNSRPVLDGLRFEMAVPKSGNPGEAFFIKYSNISYHDWQYNPLGGKYERFQETEDDHGQVKQYAPLKDSLTGEQLAADNVVILRTTHQVVYQSNSTTIYDMPFTGTGGGYAFRDGQLYPLNWTRPLSDTLPTLALPNGRPYPLKP
jgi:hypothetical protein